MAVVGLTMRKTFDGFPDHLNPTVLGVHKRDAHFEGLSAVSDDELKSGQVNSVLDLNGTWKFKLYPHPDQVDSFFNRLEDDDFQTWNDIEVPGVWELQGFGTPYYIANSYPPQINVKPSKIPSISATDNPTGAYVRIFDLPEAFLGQRIFIRFLAVKSAFQLWINGVQVGFSKASMTTHEFDITEWVRPGLNKIAVLVIKYSDGTYLEDQDMWFFGGICRDVMLVCEPQTYLYDVFASCALINDTTDAKLTLDVVLDGPLPKDLNLKVKLGKEIIHQVKVTVTSLTLESLVEKPLLWTAETPNLYPITLILSDGKRQIQMKSFRFGFREIKIQDAKFLINGKPIKFKGVNRHDFDPQKAWGIDKETRRKDLLIMKAHNINAIRTSHYPNHPHLYDLADELGFYVIDEADLESHGVRTILPKDDPIWTKAGIDRNQRMVLRDRNHPCIVMWSLGNEAGEGTSFMAMKKAILELDTTRPIHYEGDHREGLSDVYSMMYPSPDLETKFGLKQDIKAQGFIEKATQLFLSRKPIKKEAYQDLPVMNCEYAHCMENSLGNFKDHVDNFERFDNWIGGFIWDFVDQAIKHTDPDGSVHWLYGGDFHEDKTDAFFCANGLIAADRSLHPAITEVKQVYANLSITDYDPKDHSVLITNKNVFIDSAYAVFIAKLLSNGSVIDQKLVTVDPIAPGSAKRIKLAPIDLNNPNELILEIEAVEKEDRPWAKKGHPIVFGQFIVKKADPQPEPEPLNNVTLRQTKEVLLIQSPSLSVSIDKKTGALTSLDAGNGNLLKAPMTLNLTRADLDNDCGIELFVPAMRHLNAIRHWEKAMTKLKVTGFKTSCTNSKATVEIHHALPNAKIQTTFTLTDSGRLDVKASILSRKDLIRFGYALGLDHTFNNVSFYGKGPQENYVDRKHGAKIGFYQGRIDDFTHHYMRPQENGNHTDIRQLTLCDNTTILRFDAITERLLEASVWPYTQDQLKAATHIDELPPHTMTTVNLDYGQKGVAGDLPGFYAGPEQYKLKRNTRLTYGFSITVISGKS